MTRPYSAALPIVHVVLRILMILNWLVGAATVALLAVMPHTQWIMSAFDLTPSPEAERVIMGLRAIAVIGIVAVPIYHFIFRWMLAIVETVRAGDPFVAPNAARLQNIAWAMLGLQILGLFVGMIVRAISTPATPVNITSSLSIGGMLAVLLTFVLARVFAEGARMRDDLEGTV